MKYVMTVMMRRVGLSVLAASMAFAMTAQAAQWDGEGTSGNLDWWNNYYSDAFPTWNSGTDLEFNFNNQGLSTLTQNIGYRDVRAIVYNSTFSQNTTLGGSDGFDLYWKIENNDTGSHTINVPIVVQGASFELNPINGNLTIGGSINNFNNRDLNVYGNNGNTLTLNTTFSGTGAGLIVNQNSIVLLNSVQTYTGDTTINAGSVQLGAANRIADSSDLVVGGSGTFNMNNNSETVASLSLASGGQVQMGTGQLIVNAGAGTWAGNLTASSGGSLVKKGAGVVSITANNSGLAAGSAIYVVGGTVGFNNNGAAGSATIYVGETSGSDAAKIDISTAGINLGNAITIRDGSSGIKTIDNASGGAITFSGNINLDNSVYVDSSLGESTTLGGVISSDGDGDAEGIIKRGFGTVTLGGANTYVGGTFIDEGTLTIGTGGDIQNSSGIEIGSSVYNGGAGNAQLALTAGADLDRSIAVKSGAGSRTISSSGSSTLSGTIDLGNNLAVSSSAGTLTIQNTVDQSNSGNNDLTVSGAGNTTINGAITATTGASDLNKQGSGVLTISADNSGSSYKLNISGGTVYLTHANALGTAYGDKINFNTANSELHVGASVAPINLGITINNVTATFNVDNGNTFTVAGAIQNGGGTANIIKSGTGNMVIDGVATYSGSTVLSAGTLTVGAAGDISSSSGVAVNGGKLSVQGTSAEVTQSAGTVAGAGTIDGDYVQNGGVLSPGNSPGQLDVAGNVTWNGGSYLWEMNDVAGAAGTDPGWDLLNIAGSLNVTGPYTISVTSLTAGNAAGDVFNFDQSQDYIGIWEIVRTTAGITLGTTPTLSLAGFSNPYGGTWSLSTIGNSLYVNYDHNAPPVSAVPEPNTLMYFGMVAVGLIALRSRSTRALLGFNV